jgi:hypothetical protein
MPSLARWLPKDDTVPSPGSAEVEATPALILTRTAPAGWVRPQGQVGVPVWVTWGTAGAVVPPPEDFLTPIGYVQSYSQTVRWVWAKIGLSESVPLVASSLALVSSTNRTAYTTGAFDAESGAPPEFLYVPLGYIYTFGNAQNYEVGVFNSGSGSIVIAMHVSGIDPQSLNPNGYYRRSLTYWRTASA